MYGDKYGEFICSGAERVHKTNTYVCFDLLR